ncbi:MAG TPA: hypothetical protein VK689_11520, partial [Armatimonadota bacterium]|nr:hypothetical protein [Armatimonadota bacterium]
MNFRDLSCFEHVSWRPSRAELRGFAVSMAVGFLLIGLLVAWRRHDLGAPTFALWGIGAALALAALVPGLGRAAYLAVLVPTGLL